MSAYLVHEDTIDYLVSFAMRGQTHARYCYRWRHPLKAVGDYPDLCDRAVNRQGDDATELGRVLWFQNDRSVSARYREAGTMPRYRFRPVADTAPLTVLKSIRCLRYQSCETDDFEATYAAELLDSIEAQAIAWLTDKEPWGWTRAYAATQAAEARAKIAQQFARVCGVPIDAAIEAPCEKPAGHVGPCRAFSLEGGA